MWFVGRLVISNPIHRCTSFLSLQCPTFSRSASLKFCHCNVVKLLRQEPSDSIISCCLSSSPRLSPSMESPPSGYRRNVGICLINSSNKVFAASRIDVSGAWQMPQGGVDDDEDPSDAAIRELREETGISSAKILDEIPFWLTYDFPVEVREKIKKQWGSDWKGQAQKWFLLRFTGNEEEINLLGDGSEKAEFAEWSWMSPQQVIDLAVDFKKPVYEEVLRIFSPHLQSDRVASMEKE